MKAALITGFTAALLLAAGLLLTAPPAGLPAAARLLPAAEGGKRQVVSARAGQSRCLTAGRRTPARPFPPPDGGAAAGLPEPAGCRFPAAAPKAYRTVHVPSGGERYRLAVFPSRAGPGGGTATFS